MNINKPLVIKVVASLSFFAFCALGFGESNYKIDICKSVVKKYVTAEFSEVVVGIGMDGNVYSELYFWSEPASDVNEEITINEPPYYPEMPSHDKSISQEVNFDNFNFHTYANVYVQAYNDTERTGFSENISEASKCIGKIDSYVSVNDWWGITYSSEF